MRCVKIGKKILSVLLSVSMVLSMCSPAFAAGNTASQSGIDSSQMDISWYDSSKQELVIDSAADLVGLSAIVGGRAGIPRDSFRGKTVKLGADIDMIGVTNFYPIGYAGPDNISFDVDFKSFSGIFDGNNRTISNITQNSDVLNGDGENGSYRDGMGLFGYVVDGTVKNLTIKNFKAEGMYADMGVVAAYVEGDCSFEGISLRSCDVSTDSCAAAGIVGWDSGRSSNVAFSDITIDSSNIFGGSGHTTAGGVMGHLSRNSKAQFENCHISAELGDETYKTGMLVGTVDKTKAGKLDLSNVVVSSTTVGNSSDTLFGGSGVQGTKTEDYLDKDGNQIEETIEPVAKFTITFENWDGTVLQSSELAYNEIPEYTGETPTKAADAQYTYTFAGWSPAITAVTDDATYTATFVKTAKMYTVEFVDEDGTVLQSSEFAYGETPVCNVEPTKNADAQYTYTFAGWTPAITAVTDDATYTATFTTTAKMYTVTFENWDGTVLQSSELAYNEIPEYTGETPTKAADAQYTYTFAGWSPVIASVTGDACYTATYEKVKVAVKFEEKFTGDFLYRVGNQNAVALGSLFGSTGEMENVSVEIDTVEGNASGSSTANSDWTKSTIRFSGTGIVTVTVSADNANEVSVDLEVVDAVNATTATGATKNNVVLLNNCGFSSLAVSDGYTLYGNGFTMTCGSDSAALDMGSSFVTLNNGTLDNVQIICPNFDYAVLYKSNMTESGNRSETTDRTRYYNVKSGVMVSGNSQILNSRISGGRAAVNVSGGNVVIDNSRIELGAVASVLVGSANSLTLRDTTLIQKPTASTYDSSKTLMGFSVLFICDADGNAAPVTLEGTLVQNAWVNEGDKQYVPSAGQSIISTVLGKTEYLHDLDGDGINESLNLGFAYMPESLTSQVNATTITDNRTNKATIPYDYAEVSIMFGKTYVYSYKNTNGTEDSFKTEAEYVPNKQGDTITVIYSDTADGLTTGKSFGTDGWTYELNVDLDKLSGYALDFSKLSMSVNGTTVTDFKVNGSAKPASPVAVTSGGITYTLIATVNGKEYAATYKVTGTETSKESPSLVASNYEAGLCVASSYGGTWHGAAPALEGIQIKYWSVAEKQYKTINLSDYTPTTTGQLNGTNTTWTYSPANGDFTLTLTGGQVHSSNNVYAMPVVCDGKLYFVAASSKGLVNSGNSARTIPVSYTFKDNNNGDELTFSHTWSVAENKDDQYKYSDFCNGTLTKLESSSGGSCVTPDTLITLDDGSQVRVDALTGYEQLLVWNMETGKLDSAPVLFVDTEEEAEYEVVHLYFSDDTEVKVIYEHGFWDYGLNRYVYLDANASDYIGHTFAKQNGEVLEKVELVDVVIETEVTTAWSPVTMGHLCYFVNDMLSMPGGVGGLFNIFEVDKDTMTYDEEAMARDIETYGLFTYEELNAIEPLSEDMFEAAGGAYLKVSLGKGNLTMDELVMMIQRYSVYFTHYMMLMSLLPQ